MSTKTEVVDDTKYPRLLPDDEVYAVRMGGGFFIYGLDGLTRTSRNGARFTKERAEEIVKEYGGKILRVPAKMPQNDLGLRYWIADEEGEKFEERELCALEHLRSYWNDIPEWFVRAMKKIAPDAHVWGCHEGLSGTADDAMMIFLDSEEFRGRWFDHAGWTGIGEKSKLAAEPYYIHAEDIAKIQDFCSRADLDFIIRGQSNHYPGSTFRIEIREEKI